MYKKVYVEITNNCNLNCDFCIKNQRPSRFMGLSDFNIILDKLKGYTKYLYFHLLGEPLLHPKLNEFIDVAVSKNFEVNITTNGYLIKRLKNKTNIRQVNISLHSYDEKYNISLEEYMDNIFEVIDNLKEHTFICLRFWVNNSSSSKMLDMINSHYYSNLNVDTLGDNIKISNNIYLSVNKEFIWPDLNNDLYDDNGSCYGLKHHIGILVDGTVVPCCLDSKGIINLGNIFNKSLHEIINSLRYQNMLQGFKNHKKCELLCKKCPIKSGIKNTNNV